MISQRSLINQTGLNVIKAKAQPANPMATNVMDVALTMGLANPITTRNVTCCVTSFVNKWVIPQSTVFNSSPKIFTVNCVTSSNGKDKTWLMDSAAFHNITGDLANLSIHSEYDGTDEVILGDGSGLTVSHIGSLESHSPNHTFILSDTLCVPNLSKNLIYVHHLTKQNNIVIEFHHFHFFVKDKITEAILL